MKIGLRADRADRVCTSAAFVLMGIVVAGCGPTDSSGSRQSAAPPKSTAANSATDSASHDAPIAERNPLPPPAAEPGTRLRLSLLPPEVIPNVSYRNGAERGRFAILESLGGGVGLIDVDNDEWPDLVLPLGGDFTATGLTGHGVALLRNRRVDFSDSSADAGLLAAAQYNHGVAGADLDHDGFADLLITGFGGVRLYTNQGDGTFLDRTHRSELNASRRNQSQWSTSAAWADFNLDGQLDLYLTHYVNWSPENHPLCFAGDAVTRDVCTPRDFEAESDQLFLSRGDGRFEEASEHFQLPLGGKGLAVLAADIDLDGDVDIYVANDTVPNFLLLNEAGTFFQDASQVSGASVSDLGTPDGSMSIDLGDYNLDGRPDLWVSNYERESFALYRSQSGTFFRHVSDVTGIRAATGQFVGWGSVFADLDLDGDEDVLVANGHVEYHPDHAPVLQRFLLFENREGAYFREVAAASADLLTPRSSRGLAIGDLDGDGLPDAVASQVNAPVSVFRNCSVAEGSFLGIRLTGTTSPSTPIGAVVSVTTSAGRQMRQLKGGGSYASTLCAELQFGIPGSAAIQAAEIHWPNGRRTALSGLTAGRRYRVLEPRQPGDPVRIYEIRD